MDLEEPFVGVPGPILWFEHSEQSVCDEIFAVGIGSRMPQRDPVQPVANQDLRHLGAHESGGGCVVLDHDGDLPSHRGDRIRIAVITRLRASEARGHPAMTALAGD